MRRIPVEDGATFGSWTVIGPADPPLRYGTLIYNCRCRCGNTSTISGNALRSGATSKCRACTGRDHKGKGAGIRKQIPVGTVFGKWTVLGLGQSGGTYGTFKWPCRCECGTLASVLGSMLRGGYSTRCRRCAAAMRRQRQACHDLTGLKFGKWFVMSRIPCAERRDYPSRAWLCRCDCGTEKAMETAELKRKGGCRSCDDHHPPVIRRPYESVYLLAKYAVTRRVSRDRQHAFTVGYEEFAAICETGRCHYCHAPLTWAKFAGPRKNFAYRMDRKDNDLGYLPGNVVGACTRCNYAKGDRYTYEEWFAMTAPYRSGALSEKPPYIRNRRKVIAPIAAGAST